MPDLRTLETFRAFVDTGSVSRAAQRVCRTQPQVGRTLTALEDEVGFPLFDRSSRPFGLTKPGREYYLQALQVLSAAQALERHALRARHSAGPHVHVFTTPFIAGAIVIDALAPLEQALGLTVSIDSRAHVDMEAWVANEVFDVGVVGFPIAHPAFEIEPFITVEAMPLATICSISSPAQGAQQLCISTFDAPFGAVRSMCFTISEACSCCCIRARLCGAIWSRWPRRTPAR